MTSYVYAITDRPEAPLPRQLGLGDAELHQVAWRDIGAIVSAHDSTPPAATAAELWRHEEVVEALMEGRAVLPARFGTLFASHQRVSDMLCRAYPQLIQDIERVRGHVEIGMRFLASPDHQSESDRLPADGTGAAGLMADGRLPLVSPNGFDGAAAAPGTAYLRAKLAKHCATNNRREVQLKLVREVCGTLAGHATERRLDAEPADRVGVSAAFLVPRERLASFRRMVGLLADAHPDLALLCTGPWPPYSFVSANVGAPATNPGGNGHAQ
jgi:hypothetical protein